MAGNKERRDVEAAEGGPAAPLPLDFEGAITDARAAIDDGLLQYFNARRQVVDETRLLRANLADGLLISVLRLIAPAGRYAMDKGRFWQILDRHNPFSPLESRSSD